MKRSNEVVNPVRLKQTSFLINILILASGSFLESQKALNFIISLNTDLQAKSSFANLVHNIIHVAKKMIRNYFYKARYDM